eukprot:XP_013979498.1 PREDICTED: PHD finger protein 3-like [Salmo salar]
MDVVDTFNHLIPSDQLDDSLLIGQNLECEASNDFGTGVDQLGDSLRNMLSDKDPMFGSASSHFNILDNEDANFQIAEATVADLDVGATEGILGTAGGGLAGTETPPVKRSVGRPRKYALGVTPERSAGRGSSNNKKPPGKPGRPRKKSTLSEKITTADELRRELYLGDGRVNINDLDLGSSMNPVVVLQRLTVTFGGFKIELLPGPSFTAFTSAENTDECYEDGSLYGEGMEYTMVQEEPLHVQNPTAGSGGGVGAAQLFVKYCADDLPLGLGPYVNPNDVQASNGALPGSPCLVETKLDDQSDSQKHDPAGVRKDASIKQAAQQHLPNSKVPTTNNPAKKQQPKLKLSALSSAKNKHLVAGKGPKGTQQHTLGKKLHQRGNMHKMDEMKAKQVLVSLKRRGEFNPAQPGPKIQRTQDGRPVKLKQRLPDMGRGGPVKKTMPSGKRPAGMSPGTTITTKLSNSHVADTQPQPQFGWTPCKRANPQKETSEEEKEEEQDEPKVKKPDKCLQKQRSRNVSRSISEPGGAGQGEARTEGQQKPSETQDHKMAAKQKQPSPHPVTSGGVRPFRKDSVERRQSTEVKDSNQRSGVSVKQETKRPKVSSSPSSKKPVSVDQIRRSVRDALKDILLKRLKESDFQASPEKAAEVAKKTERELFAFYRDTDCKYKSKYRSLMFNLKDTKNNVLFKRVLKGEISPGTLIRMSPEELASKELAAWRQRETRHAIEMIEKEQREVERRPITKITHKGEIEIESQEPGKAPEAIEPEPEPVAAPKVTEEPVEVPQEKTLLSTTTAESVNIFQDTTSLHKTHLFDLNCKICTGRMAPPVEEAPTKMVKVATTVVRRRSATSTTEAVTKNTQSTTTTSSNTEGQTKNTPSATTTSTEGETPSSSSSSAKDDDLHLKVLEESLLSAKIFSNYEGRSVSMSGRDSEASFLSNLQPLWRGLVNMPAVAKLLTKAFPVSGVLDHLTEDLPESFQMGGRISPQIVWDYLDKIRATGTKEVCLIRFSPETDEDEIHYTLLYAYFSSRKRFGVVANNLKQVKDMYLIPLGAIEKVPHQLVPFDGPGLENNRPNLLLGLIIRQRPKRDFLPVDINETARFIPESKPGTATTTVTVNDKEVTREEEENSYFPLCNPPLLGDDGREPSAPQTSKADGGAATTPGSSTSTKSPSAGAHRQTGFVIKKREPKPVKAEEPVSSSLAETSTANNNALAKEEGVVYRGPSVSLKDKPPDVSTESFLASLSTDPNTDGSLNKGDSALCEKDKSKEEKTPTLLSITATSNASVEESVPTPKPLPSGILKKSSAYSNMTEEPTAVQSAGSEGHPQPVPVLTTRKYRPMAAQHGYPSHHHQTDYRRPPPPDHGPLQVGPYGPIPLHPGGPPVDFQYQPAPPVPPFCNTAPPPFQHPPQLPTNFSYPTGPPPPMMFPPPHDPQMQNHAGITQWPQPGPGPTSPNSFPGGLPLAYGGDPQRFASAESSNSNQNLPPSAAAKEDQKGAAERILYSDPWDRQPGSGHKKEDRDQYGRHRHHSESRHGEKSRNHSQERGKKRDRSRSRERDRSKDSSSHHRGSRHHSKDERHGHSERRKERHHSDGDHGNRHKHSRRDSDYEKSRRSSKDSHS